VRLLWCVLLWPEKSSIKNDEFSSNLLLKIKIDSKIEKDEKKNNMYFFFCLKVPGRRFCVIRSWPVLVVHGGEEDSDIGSIV
jgi:hypothetical protein